MSYVLLVTVSFAISDLGFCILILCKAVLYSDLVRPTAISMGQKVNEIDAVEQKSGVNVSILNLIWGFL